MRVVHAGVPIYGPATKAQPDCDDVTGLMFPLPEKGGIEGSGDYTCGSAPGKGGDCHLLVYDGETPRSLSLLVIYRAVLTDCL